MSSVSLVQFNKELKFENLLCACPADKCNKTFNQLQNLLKHIGHRLNGGPKFHIDEDDQKAHVDMVENRLSGAIYYFDQTANKYVLKESKIYRAQFSDFCKMKYFCSLKNVPFDFGFVLRGKKVINKCPWCDYSTKKFEYVKRHILHTVNSSKNSKDKLIHHQQVVKCLAFKKRKNVFIFNSEMKLLFLRFCKELQHRSDSNESLYHPPFLSLLLLFPKGLPTKQIERMNESNLLSECLDLGTANDPIASDPVAQDLGLNSDHRFSGHTNILHNLLEDYIFEKSTHQKIEEQLDCQDVEYYTDGLSNEISKYEPHLDQGREGAVHKRNVTSGTTPKAKKSRVRE